MENELFKNGCFVYIDGGNNDIYVYLVQDSDNESSLSSSQDSNESYNKDEVGHLTTEEDEDGNIWLVNIIVENSYQRRGIATKMLELAIENFELSYIACVKEHRAYDLSLTPAGERFIAGCLKKGIINPDMCIFSNATERNKLGYFILKKRADDPGLDSNIVAQACRKFRPKDQSEHQSILDPRQLKITNFFKPINNKDQSSEEDKDSPDESSEESEYSSSSSSSSSLT